MRETRNHRIRKFEKGKEINFEFEARKIRAFENETVTIAFYRNGIDVFSESSTLHRPGGIFCAIGKCSSCTMRVKGIPNVRTCILPLREEMVVEKQQRFGKLPDYIEKHRRGHACRLT